MNTALLVPRQTTVTNKVCICRGAPATEPNAATLYTITVMACAGEVRGVAVFEDAAMAKASDERQKEIALCIDFLCSQIK